MRKPVLNNDLNDVILIQHLSSYIVSIRKLFSGDVTCFVFN